MKSGRNHNFIILADISINCYGRNIKHREMINPIITPLSQSHSRCLSLILSCPSFTHTHTLAQIVVLLFSWFLPFVIRRFRLVGKNICKRCNHILFRNVCELWVFYDFFHSFDSLQCILFENCFFHNPQLLSIPHNEKIEWGKKESSTYKLRSQETRTHTTSYTPTKYPLHFLFLSFWSHTYLALGRQQKLSTRKVNWNFVQCLGCR